MASAVRGDLAPLERLKRSVLGANIDLSGELRRILSIGAFIATTTQATP